MKRLLLGPALIAPLALFGCNWGTKTPEMPKVPEVIRQIPLDDFNTRYPGFERVPASEFEKANPAPSPKKPQAKAHAYHHHPDRPDRHRGPVPHTAAPVEPLPPQQGPICIFPLNMIPNCTPQEIR